VPGLGRLRDAAQAPCRSGGAGESRRFCAYADLAGRKRHGRRRGHERKSVQGQNQRVAGFACSALRAPPTLARLRLRPPRHAQGMGGSCDLRAGGAWSLFRWRWHEQCKQWVRRLGNLRTRERHHDFVPIEGEHEASVARCTNPDKSYRAKAE
jgi:hypothetical protein